MCIVKKYNTASNLCHVTKMFKYTFLYMKNIVKPVKTTKGNLKMWPLWAVALYIQVKIIYVSTFKLIVHPSVVNFPSFWLDSYLGIDHGSMWNISSWSIPNLLWVVVSLVWYIGKVCVVTIYFRLKLCLKLNITN